MKREVLKYWLAAAGLKKLDRSLLREALSRFGGAVALFERDGDELDRFSPGLAVLIRTGVDWDAIERELDSIEKEGVRVLTITDPAYPWLLQNSFDPPLLLYLKGKRLEQELGEAPALAIVGTRKTSRYGDKTSEFFGSVLAEAGLVIVSGMARGCDSAAHKGALKAGGMTVAVLGTGIDRIYPADNRKLYEEIAERGLLVSEFPIGTAPLQQNFPQRNRIISGLSHGALVVEAPLRSGAMMTARLSLENGREVFAVPGRIDNKESDGPNRLLRDGATLVTEPDDILTALCLSGITVKKTGRKQKTDIDTKKIKKELGPEAADAVAVLGLLRDGPVHMDALAENSGLAAQRLSSLLLRLELMGYILKRPGNLFEIN